MKPPPDTHTADRLQWLERVQDDEKIAPAAFCLAFAISRHLNRMTGDAWPGQKRLGALAGVKERQVRNLIRQLVERGHLTVEKGGFNRPDRYRMARSDRQPIAAWTGSVVPHGSVTECRMDRQSIAEVTGNPLPPNPLTEPSEREAALLTAEDSQEIASVWASLPKASASRSNAALVRKACVQIIGSGVSAKALRIAVGTFVKQSSDAKDQDGRFMGPAHKWLTDKRGWEAYLPSADALFLDGRSEADAEWLGRIRSWERCQWWRAEHGPPPDQPGCKAPPSILAYCRETVAPTQGPAKAKERVTWV